MPPNKRKRSSSHRSPKPRAKIPRITEKKESELPITTINTIISNPGFVHISQKIFGFLDDKSQLNCRLVCESWKTQIGKKHALKKYDQFTLNTSCFWGSTGSNITQVVQFRYKNNE